MVLKSYKGAYRLNIIDIFISLGIALTYMAIFKVQKHFFTNSYFSISQLLIEFESGIRWNRIIVRIIITMIMTMLLIYTINNYFIIIIGMGLGSLFIVLPNFLSEKFIEYNLQNHKNLYRITLLVFVILNIIIVVLTINIYDLLFIESHINRLPKLIINIIFALFTQWLYVFLTDKLNSKKLDDQSNEYQEKSSEMIDKDSYNLYKFDDNIQFKNKLELLKNRLTSNVKFTDEEIVCIYKNANEYEISFEELHALLSIEKFNRGDFVTQFKEYISVKVLPDFTSKLNPTIGIGQIRLSNAQKHFKNFTEKALLEALLDKEFNISLTAKIIKDIQGNQESENPNLELIKVYTTGDKEAEISSTIRLYYFLFEWLIHKNS